MRNLLLLASAAAMAVSVPALAQGNGKGKGGGGPDQAEQRGGGQAEARGRGNGRGAAEARAERGKGQARQAERRAVRQIERVERQAVRGARQAPEQAMRAARRDGARDWSGWMNERRGGGRATFGREARSLRVRAQRGCPPGLARQNEFCMPPGQLRKARMIGQRAVGDRFAAVPEMWRDRFAERDDHYYRYDPDGFIYRIGRGDNLVSTVFPLFANGLGLGAALPLGYDTYNLPVAYRDRFADDADHLYRYDDGAIYRVDGRTRLIEGVVALLAGNGLNVGSPLPSGYDAYNLPTAYRDRYSDSDDSLYRYSNGGIYQVDPTTRLVQALIEMVL